MSQNRSEEKRRLEEDNRGTTNWKKWGPYLSERQWGTVREDYSNTSDAWNYFSHHQAKSRAYRWGEDGIAGISDDKQLLCFALSFWNTKDPVIKERLFGLTNGQGNHGEDVKEYYFYLDNTPTHSYMKYLYKYPQAAFPYDDLIFTNEGRTKKDPEYELLDTGVFDEDKYFDIVVEYAKEGIEDICIRVSATNRGNKPVPLHILPTLWFRNTWSWEKKCLPPVLEVVREGDQLVIHASHSDCQAKKVLGDYYLYMKDEAEILVTNNETNRKKLFNSVNSSLYVKDGIQEYIVKKAKNTVSPSRVGTKASVNYKLSIDSGETKTIYLRLTKFKPEELQNPFSDIEKIFEGRIQDADTYYDEVIPEQVRENEDQERIMRQAISGMLWTKQFYYYDVSRWLKEHGVTPWTRNTGDRYIRNIDWYHMEANDILSMPDKWEYPWFAAWDTAFHMKPFYYIDPKFTKDQLALFLGNEYQHPNGQIPAYEWNFTDVNPPVHAWVVMQTYLQEREEKGAGDIVFLRYCFGKLALNFNWWVNRKDPEGNNLFQGGFLGLDNIGVFDRSSELPTGGHLAQADGTAWMAFFSMQMLRICFELAKYDSFYESYVYKYFSHAMWISGSMDRIGEHDDALWDEEDGFFYDLLHFPDGKTTPLKSRSLVGLFPLMSVCVVSEELAEMYQNIGRRTQEFVSRYPEIEHNLHYMSPKGKQGRTMISIIDERKLRLILTRMLDEEEFLSPFGIRSLSKYHKEHPYVFKWGEEEFKVEYQPGESDSRMFGGNSNWRGPVWMPANILLINSLLNYYTYYGEEFKIECPTGSGQMMTLLEVARFISKRLINLFQKNEKGKRAVFGKDKKFQTDKHWTENILFYEYFHADTGAGLGASHQTGWTGCIIGLIDFVNTCTPDNFKEELHMVVSEI